MRRAATSYQVISLFIGTLLAVFIVYLKQGQNFHSIAKPSIEPVTQWEPDDLPLVNHEETEEIVNAEIKESLAEDIIAEGASFSKIEEEDEMARVNTAFENTRKASEETFKDHPMVIKAAKKVTCRHRWTKYLKQQEPKPTRKLDELLKRYIRLHDKHLRDMDLEKSLKLPLHSRSNKIRYLVWVPSENGELAGQMLSLVSAFLFALLTDRVLLVDFPPEIEHVFCEPFPNSSWLLPRHIKEWLNENSTKAIYAVRQRQPIRSAVLRIERLNMQDDKHLLSCHGTLKSVFGHIQWLTIQSDYSFLESIQSNRYHQHQLSQLFGWEESENYEEKNMFATLNRFLLHPSNYLWEKITSQYHRFFSDNDPKPTRILIHASSINEGKKHADAVTSVLFSTEEMRENLTCSVYTTPYHLGSHWLKPEDFRDSAGVKINGIHVGSSNSLGPGLSPFVGEWRKFVTDVWMAGWAAHYLVPQQLPISSVPGIYYRNSMQGVWLMEDQLDSRKFKEPAQLSSWTVLADRVDCSLIKRK